MNLKDIRHWVFDMDGTLTVAVHDFAEIRRALGAALDALASSRSCSSNHACLAAASCAGKAFR